MKSSVSLRVASLLVALIGTSAACSFLVDTSDQCQRDADCGPLGQGLTCRDGVCGAGTSSELGPPGCVSETPAKDLDYFNACTSADCIPFDNCKRLGLCNDQTLPPLVGPPSATSSIRLVSSQRSSGAAAVR